MIDPTTLDKLFPRCACIHVCVMSVLKPGMLCAACQLAVDLASDTCGLPYTPSPNPPHVDYQPHTAQELDEAIDSALKSSGII